MKELIINDTGNNEQLEILLDKKAIEINSLISYTLERNVDKNILILKYSVKPKKIHIKNKTQVKT